MGRLHMCQGRDRSLDSRFERCSVRVICRATGRELVTLEIYGYSCERDDGTLIVQTLDGMQTLL